MRCLVTGASGYIGTALCTALRGDGHEVLAQVFRAQAAPGLQAVYRCDLSEGLTHAALRDALHGVECVFHLAGIAHQRASLADYQSLNVDATQGLAQAALAAGVSRFVFMSSVKARAASPYGASKARAEALLQALSRNAEMDLVILRPALVYGAEARGQLAWLRRWVQLRLPELPRGGERSMICCDDLVQLCLRLLRCKHKGLRQLVVTDGQRYSVRRLQRALVAALGRTPLLPAPPRFCWRAAARAVDALRGEAAGSLWGRVQDDELFAAQGLEALDFVPTWDFESWLNRSSPNRPNPKRPN